MITRLLSGEFEGDSKALEGAATLDKKCMLVYCGDFDSMDGPVKIKAEDIQKLSDNHNTALKKLGRLAEGVTPMKFSPPIQLDHSTSAKDTVGRLVGDLEVGEHQLEDGSKVPALFGTARILGKDNVEKVSDGRWTHLSIGADLENHTISELTITPFPAAAEASMMSKMAGEIVKKDKHKGILILIKKEKKNGKDVYCAYDEDSEKITPDHSSIKEALADAKGYIDENDPIEMSKKRLAEYEVLNRDNDIAYVVEANSMDDAIKKVRAKIQKDGSYRDISREVRGPDGKTIKLKQGEEKMDYKTMKDAMDLYAKARQHLMDEKKMADKEADEELNKMADEDVKKMASEQDEKLKKLAAEKEEEEKKLAADEEVKEKTLSSLKAQGPALTKLAAAFKQTNEKVRLAAKISKMSIRLSKLKADAKISPAEMKKIDLTALALKDDKTIDAVLGTYEQRESLVPVGLYGTTKALTAAQLHKHLKKSNISRLQLETELNMPSKREAALKKLAAMEDAEKEVNVHIDNVPQGEHDVGMADYDMAYDQMKKLMDEGKHEEAKAHMSNYMKKLTEDKMAADMPVENASEQMSALAEEVKKMQTGFVDFVKMTAPHFGLKPEELV